MPCIYMRDVDLNHQQACLAITEITQNEHPELERSGLESLQAIPTFTALMFPKRLAHIHSQVGLPITSLLRFSNGALSLERTQDSTRSPRTGLELPTPPARFARGLWCGAACVALVSKNVSLNTYSRMSFRFHIEAVRWLGSFGLVPVLPCTGGGHVCFRRSSFLHVGRKVYRKQKNITTNKAGSR